MNRTALGVAITQTSQPRCCAGTTSRATCCAGGAAQTITYRTWLTGSPRPAPQAGQEPAAPLLPGGWDLTRLSDSVELLVTELMGNAVKASPSAEWIQPVRLWLLSDHYLTIVSLTIGWADAVPISHL